MLSIACFISVCPVHKTPEAQWPQGWSTVDVNTITDRCMHVEHVAQRYCCFLALIRSPSSSLKIDVTVEVIFHLTLIVSIPFIYLFFYLHCMIGTTYYLI